MKKPMQGINQFSRGALKLGLLAISALLLHSRGTQAETTAAVTPTRQEVGDFSLLDQNGRFHQLRRQPGKRAVVLMVAGNGCPVVRQNLPKLKALRDKFSNVNFWLLNA